jgi:ABC-type branched-subunit amino acid transport system permease subunit
MNLTIKIMTMICLMVGTALFVISLDSMLGYVGLLDLLSHDLAIILLIGGFYLISNTKEKTYVRSN